MNKLVWKLLRRHVSVPQLLGFALANLVGMLIVILAYQFYKDVNPIFTSEDSFMKADYLIISKKIGMGSSISGSTGSFSQTEIEELSHEPFATRVAPFTSTAYKVDAHMGVNGTQVLSSELFFESVPDEFIDVPLSQWHYTAGSNEVPIVLPRSYITMYNFGFAQSHSLPKLSEGLVGMIDLNILIQGNGRSQNFKGRVIGFSSRINTILVPQSFMDWSNRYFSSQEPTAPTRLIMKVGNPADQRISQYLQRKGWEVEDDKLNAEKTTYFLRLTVTLVMGVGLVISALSFYILMLSIYLLVQKNATKLENLLLMGYSPSIVARPYQTLTVSLNLVVLLLALGIVFILRQQYMEVLTTLFPDLNDGSLVPAICLGSTLFVAVSLCNILAISHKIRKIWKRKE